MESNPFDFGDTISWRQLWRELWFAILWAGGAILIGVLAGLGVIAL